MPFNSDEFYSYLTEEPLAPDYFRTVPCEGSTEENPHTSLVVSKSIAESSWCSECQIDKYHALKSKRSASIEGSN